jgi:sugar lactone lactonase YvrE
LLDGLAFAEGPRWRDGKLWFSDMHTGQVATVDLAGRTEIVVKVPGQPSGLGWTPNGRLLIASMTDRCLLRLDPSGLTEVADLSALASHHCNDMVVDEQGRAYIGNFGFNIFDRSAAQVLGQIVLVTSDGAARIVADEMAFPNGSVITPDGRTLIVAETFAARLTAFDIAADGSLSNRRIWAEFDDRGVAPSLAELAGRVSPDGICLDAKGAIWVASPQSRSVLRVRQGGEVTDRVEVSTVPYACMLGGEDGRTLFILTAKTSHPQNALAQMSGKIETIEVAVSGAGRP